MIIENKSAADLNKKLVSSGKRIVFTNGVFDIIHRGHAEYLNRAKELGDVLIVGLNSDPSVKRLKGESRPVNNQDDRAYVLDSLRAVDYVVVFGEDTPERLIEEIKPDVLVKGGDYDPTVTDRHDPGYIAGSDSVKSRGGRVEVIPLVRDLSTTSTINRIMEKL